MPVQHPPELVTSRKALVALGANLPSGERTPLDTLRIALKLLQSRGLQLVAGSRFYATPCFPAGAGPDFVNAVAQFSSEFSPANLLRALKDIETDLGRVSTGRWAARIVDLDLLAMDDLVLPDVAGFDAWRALPPELQGTTAPDRLILPHPRLQDRAFVLVPLAEIAPDWVHPVLKLRAADLCAALPATERDAVRPLNLPGGP